MSNAIQEYINGLGPLAEPDILNGELSFAIYHAWMAHLSDETDHQQKSFESVGRAIQMFKESSRPNGSFAGGMAGLGMTLNFLDDLEILDAPVSLVDNIDQVVHNWTKSAIGAGDFDMLHGAGGTLGYLLDRIGHTIHKEEFETLLKGYLNLGITSDDSIQWKTPKFYLSNSEDEVLNQSLSHGGAGILILLNRIYEKGVAKNLVGDAIKKIMNGMLQLETNPGLYKTFYATRIFNGVAQEGRLAWCYGDLGILLALKQLNGDFDAYKSQFKIEEMMRFHTERRDLEDAQIDNPGICHGSGGLHYIFGYLKEGVPDGDYIMDSQEYWGAVTADFISNKTMHEMYTSKDRKGNDHVHYGLLEGPCGTALSMREIERINGRSWSEIFLMY